MGSSGIELLPARTLTFVEHTVDSGQCPRAIGGARALAGVVSKTLQHSQNLGFAGSHRRIKSDALRADGVELFVGEYTGPIADCFAERDTVYFPRFP